MKHRHDTSTEKIIRCWRFFSEHDEWTRQQLADYTGYSQELLGHLVRKMNCKGPDRLIRVCDYRRDARGCHNIKVYEFDTAPDVAKPKALTGSQRMRRVRERRANHAQRLVQQAVFNMSKSTKEPIT